MLVRKYQSFYANTTGYGVAIGAYAATANTTGAEIVAVGLRALQSNTTGSNNTIVGANVGFSNISGNVILATGDGAIKFPWDGTYYYLNAFLLRFLTSKNLSNQMTKMELIYQFYQQILEKFLL